MKRPRQLVQVWLSVAFSAAAVGKLPAQSVSPAPVEIVRNAVQNEVKSTESTAKFMFRETSQKPDGSKTKLIVETRDAMAGLSIAVDGHPLPAEQRDAELKRLEQLANDPADLEKKRKHEKDDAERTKRIIAAFPDAFIFQSAGTAEGEENIGAPGDRLVRLKFSPNPKYSPPSHLEQILTGMEGTILIDSKQYRIAKIDGNLMKEVEFGWGFFGHLDRGGHFMVQQADMGGGNWEMTRMDLAFTGKALFKSLHIKAQETFSDFKSEPEGLTFAQGLELLKKQEAVIAVNHPLK